MDIKDIKVGAEIRGLSPSGIAVVKRVDWYESSVRVIFETTEDGLCERAVTSAEAEGFTLLSEGVFWTFKGSGSIFRLASEAHRIGLAHLFDPYLAVHTSQIESLPHQITAVYGEMLKRQPLRFLLADDPGAGKTIMAGLLIKELRTRTDLQRCLIVAPGSLVEQWQDELAQKFDLDFSIISRATIENSRTGNPFDSGNLLIARLDMLSRNEELLEKLKSVPEFDLIVCDEAHRMSATYFGNDIKYTKRYHLGRRLGAICRHFLLMSATPHNGKEEDFQLFMALLDGDRFEGKFRNGVHKSDASDMMRRLTKEELLTFEGKPLFPERRAYTVKYELSDEEAALYARVTDYVREEMNRVQRNLQEDGKRRNTVGFALQVLQRRLASSPEAIYQSIRRRCERLQKQMEELETLQHGDKINQILAKTDAELDEDSWDDIEDAPESEIDDLERQILSQATAAATVEELRIEIEILQDLQNCAFQVRHSHTDTKWLQLSKTLNDELMIDGNGNRRKLIIFSESRDTLNYLEERVGTLLGRPEALVVLHGGVTRENRRKLIHSFNNNKEVLIMLANDAVGEGVNLQRAHLMVNYDLPWNPNRLEQRFGRIHRIGQQEVCHLWNMVAEGTREGAVYATLLDKLKVAKESLGGRVYDVLGRLFVAKPLRDLLFDAVIYNDREDVKENLNRVVNDELDLENFNKLLKESATVNSGMTLEQVAATRLDMERAQARRLQPHFISSFFLEAFEHLGGRALPREAGRYEVTHVPNRVIEIDRQEGRGDSVLQSYERICFEKDKINNHPPATFVCPGHPLFDAVRRLTLQDHKDLLKQGSILIDDNDDGQEIRLLVYLEHALQDGRKLKSGDYWKISEDLQFIEFDGSGKPHFAGYAPYLDYRPAEEGELEHLGSISHPLGAGQDMEQAAIGYAMKELVPRHLERVKQIRLQYIDKVETLVRERLQTEINHWDSRASELKKQEEAGKQPKVNYQVAAKRAEDLSRRLDARVEELKTERDIRALPPRLFGGALIVPKGLLASAEKIHSPDSAARKVIEKQAMDAVMLCERKLGREPTDVSAHNLGYDIESKDSDSDSLYFIEVKGSWHEKRQISVTRNEILCAYNEPQRFRLAIVRINEKGASVPCYLSGYDYGEPSFAENSRSFDVEKLLNLAGKPH